MTSDPAEDLCRAVANPLPTPGAGPCAAVLAAHGTALVEMSLGIMRRKLGATSGDLGDSVAELGDLAELAAVLAAVRDQARRAAEKDAHAYCGFLAASVFDKGGDQEERSTRRMFWMERCIEVPLTVARCATEAAKIGGALEVAVRQRAPSAKGDLAAGLAMLLAAAEVSLDTADHNLASSPGPRGTECW